MIAIKFLIMILFMQQNYEVIKRSDKHIIMLKKEIIETRLCDFNSARIYELKGNKYLLMPSIIGQYAILYHDKKVMDEHIKEKYFPLNDLETDSPYEPEKEKIENIEDNIKIYVDYVVNKFELQSITSHTKSIDAHLEILTNKINKFGLKNLTRYDIMSIGLYVDEIFRQNTKTNWYIEKILTLNTYWVPSLINSKGEKFSVTNNVFKSIDDYNFLDLNSSYKLEKDDFDGVLPLIGN